MKLISAGLLFFLMPSKKVWHSTDKYRRTIYRCNGKARSHQMDSFIQELRNQDLIKELDARLWGSLMDYVMVGVDGSMTVVFRDGTKV